MSSARPWVLMGVGLAFGCVQAGCARLREFRDGERPGLATASRPGGDAATAKGGDLYARSLSRGRSAALLARNETTPRAADPGDGAGARDLTLPPSDQPSEGHDAGVALQPPVSDPSTKGKESGPALASRGASPSWQPREQAEPGEPATPAPGVRPKSSSGSPAAILEAVLAESRARLDTIDTYQVLLTGRERVGGQLTPPEDVLLSFRRDPKAVRLEWKGGPHKGREVIYSATENGGLMHVNMADSVLPVPRLSLPPDSPLALRNSRHPITEAGFETVLTNVEQAIARGKAGDPEAGAVTYAGMEQPEGLDRPCHKIVRVTPSGETWLVYIDPRSQLPALVQATAADGELLERYLFRNPIVNVAELAQADAFDVNRRWGDPKGLFSRLARSGAANPQPSASSVTR